jgi:hypothetical protein
MDSRNIYIAASNSLRNVEWEWVSEETEWIFVGEGGTFRESFAQQRINSFFKEESLFLVDGRHNSTTVNRDNAAQTLASCLKERNVILCSQDFTHLMEFSYIGIMRWGVKKIPSDG